MYWLFGRVIFSAIGCNCTPNQPKDVVSPQANNPKRQRRESVVAMRVPVDTIAYNIVKDVRNMRVLTDTQLEHITTEFSREQILSLMLVYNHVIENVNTYMETH